MRKVQHWVFESIENSLNISKSFQVMQLQLDSQKLAVRRRRKGSDRSSMNDEAVMNRDTHIDNNDTENNDQKVTLMFTKRAA